MKRIKKAAAFVLGACIGISSLPTAMAADAQERIAALEKSLPALEELFDECREQNIPTDYEDIKLEVIKKFSGYVAEDIVNDKAERAEYTADKLEKLYDEAYNALSGYLSGAQTPKSVPRYRTSNVEISRSGYIADNLKDGETKRENVFFTGYMGYDELRKDVERLPKLGVNMMGLEIGARTVIISPDSGFAGGWRVSYTNKGENTLASVEDSIGRNSTSGLRITNGGGTVKITKAIPVTANTEYEIGCYSLNKSGGGVTAQIGGTTFSIKNASTSGRFAVSKTTFQSGDNESLTLTITSSADGENVLDDFFLRVKGTSQNLFKYGCFEERLTVKDGLGIDKYSAECVQSALQRAADNNIAVDLLISPHYFPSFVLEEESTYKHGGSGFGGGGVEWYKARIRQVLDEYIDALVPQVADYPSLMSICLTNEPMFNMMYSDESVWRAPWTAWLEKKYTTVSNMKASHKSTYNSYNSFGEVPVPSGAVPTWLFYDWKEFNEEMFADWHKAMADRIRAIAPGIKVHTKMVDYLSRIDNNYEMKFMLTGTDAKMFSDFSDVHGNDAHAYLEPTHMYRMQSKLEWYDYLTTIEEKPIHNSEDHIIRDKSTLYGDEQAEHVAADMWQGAIHGRSSTTAWVYARTYNDSSLLSDSLLNRPDVVAAIGKTNLDLNRLAPQVTALQSEDIDVGVIFQTASRVYNRNYMNCLYNAYEALLYSGNRVGVIDENSIEKLAGCKLVILPDVRYVTNEMLTALKNYAANGGKIIAVGDDCLKYNEYEIENPTADVDAILSGAVKLSALYSSYELQSPTLSELTAAAVEKAEPKFRIADADTGEILSDVECRYTDYSGKTLVNLCRYKWESRNVKILAYGKETAGFYDLISEKPMNVIKLDGYTPIMGYVIENGPESPKNVTAEWSDGEYRISWESAAEYVKIYKDGKMIKRMAASDGKYTFSGDYADTAFEISAEGEYGIESEKTAAKLKKGFVTWLKAYGGSLKLCGYSGRDANVTYKAVENGKDPRQAINLAALGEINVTRGGFETEIPLAVSDNRQRDFVVYASDSKMSNTMYLSYIKNIGSLTDVTAYYYGGAYRLSWKSESNETISISDGESTKSTAASDGGIVWESGQSNKSFTISTESGIGTIVMPPPLMAYCRTVDSVMTISGISRANTKLMIRVKKDNSQIYADYVNADEYGFFKSSFAAAGSVKAGEELSIEILADNGGGKTIKCEYAGKMPLGISKYSENEILITGYTAKKIENAKIIYVVYKDGVLDKCIINDLTVGAEEALTAKLPEGSTAVYIWDGTNSMIPLAREYKK